MGIDLCVCVHVCVDGVRLELQAGGMEDLLVHIVPVTFGLL